MVYLGLPHGGIRMAGILTLDPKEKFEALKMRYEDHVELLRFMTKLDLEIFGGFMTVQVVAAGFLAAHPPKFGWAVGGFLLADFALAVVACVLLRNNALRRKEAVGTLKNILAILGFSTPGAFAEGVTVNAVGDFRLWGPWYIAGVVIAYVGVAIVVLASWGGA
jgi:hypothetical protein